MRDLLEYQFVIPGACPPKGSRVPVGKGRATRESSKRVEPWTIEAVRSMRDRLGKPLASFSGPVYVEALFVFKRPEVTEFEFPTAPSIGDLDKLLRCLNDALTKAGVIEDDRFIVEFPGPPRKIWGDSDYTIVRVGAMQPQSPNLRLAVPLPNGGIDPDCPARKPGGDGYMCICLDPAACGALSVTQNRAPNPYGPGPELPPAVERSSIEVGLLGRVDRIPGLTDYGVCPRCERAPLKPGDNHSGVQCSSDTCNYWFCY